MLLNKYFCSAFIIALSFSAMAGTLPVESLEPGSYQLVSGDKELCMNFSLSEKQLKASTLEIGKRYTFELKAGQENLPSDLDKKCTFKENSLREDTGIRQTILTRINQEICSGKVKSTTKSTVTLSRGEVQLVHHMDGDLSYECLWKKK